MSASRVRLSLLQALSFGSMGAVFPFLALELRSAGLGGWALAGVLTSIPILRIAVAPVWGWASDRAGELRRPLLVSAGLALLGITVLVGLPGLAAFAGAFFLATGRAGSAPLIEAGCVQATADAPGAYGRIRRWGSVGFIFAVLAAGIIGDRSEISPLWIGVVLGLGLMAVAAGLPRGAAPPARVPLFSALGRVLRDPALALLLLASALHFSTISLYDAFFAVHLQALGHGTTWVGIATVLGVGVEVVVLTASGALLRRIGLGGLLIGAMVLAIPRWLLTVVVVDPVVLVGIQAVHGVVYGAFWIAAIAMIAERAPRSLAASAQGLMAAALGGVGAGIGMLVGSAIVSTTDTSWLFVAAAVLSCIASAVATASVLAARRPVPTG